MQELNSVGKNCGVYLRAQVFLSMKLGRPMSPEQIAKLDEMRSVLAPSDNFGEVTSPIVVIFAVMFEALFYNLARLGSGFLEPAPLFAQLGILEGWGAARKGHELTRGGSAIVLCIVLVLRVFFFWFEIRLGAVFGGATAPSKLVPRPQADEEAVVGGADGEFGSKTRKVSAVVLYRRMVSSRSEFAWHLQHMAIILVAFQPGVFAVFAARCLNE